MHFLARGLGCSPQEIGEMEFVEFIEWVDLEQEAQEEEAKLEAEKMKAALRGR